MRDTRRECRVEAVQVERDIERRLERKDFGVVQRPHLDHLDAKAPRLLRLVPVHRADADLYQSRGEPFLHDARKGAGVRVAVALELVVEVGVRVNMQDAQARVDGMERAQRRIGDGVVAAQHQRPRTPTQQRRDGRRDLAARAL
jgi:hypothetical protein